MHVKALKVFCDIVAYRSFSRAANENDISQSGASQMVQQLEDRLRVKLIDRSKRPFVLTPEGEVYYEGCRKLVQNYYALEEQVRTFHDEVDGRVGVASIYSVGLSHMSRILREFLQKHPKANVRLQYQHPHRVYEMVETDQVDLGLVSYPRSTRTIKALAWREEPMVLVCAPDHEFAARHEVSLEDLVGQSLISFDRNLEIRHEIDKALAARAVEVQVVMEFDNIETIKRAIEIDAGVSLLPKPTIEREVSAGTLVCVPLFGEPLVRPVGIVFRRGKELGKTAQRFMQLLQEHATAALPETPANGHASEGSPAFGAAVNGFTAKGISANGIAHRDCSVPPVAPVELAATAGTSGAAALAVGAAAVSDRLKG